MIATRPGKIKELAVIQDGMTVGDLVAVLRKHQLLTPENREAWIGVDYDFRDKWVRVRIFERTSVPNRPRLHDHATVKGEPEKSMNRYVRVSSIDAERQRCHVSNRDGTITQFVPFDAFEYDEDTGKWTVAVPGYGSTPLPPPPPIISSNWSVASELSRYSVESLEEALGMLDSLAAEQLTGDAAKRRDNAKLQIAKELLGRGVVFW